MPREVAAEELDFASIYEDWLDDVLRWLAAMGVPEYEIEDVAQEVFVIVRRKLHQFEGGNLGGWLYAFALRKAQEQRRRAWFRRVLSRSSDAELEDHATATGSPLEMLERKETRQLLDHVLARMTDKRRRVFILFEFEGYSGEEIAALEAVPPGTVFTRLHHARKDFIALAKRLNKAKVRR
jgi:RNA polymerase sigma-70 factor (ECF subfamily)